MSQKSLVGAQFTQSVESGRRVWRVKPVSKRVTVMVMQRDKVLDMIDCDPHQVEFLMRDYHCFAKVRREIDEIYNLVRAGRLDSVSAHTLARQARDKREHETVVRTARVNVGEGGGQVNPYAVERTVTRHCTEGTCYGHKWTRMDTGETGRTGKPKTAKGESKGRRWRKAQMKHTVGRQAKAGPRTQFGLHSLVDWHVKPTLVGGRVKLEVTQPRRGPGESYDDFLRPYSVDRLKKPDAQEALRAMQDLDAAQEGKLRGIRAIRDKLIAERSYRKQMVYSQPTPEREAQLKSTLVKKREQLTGLAAYMMPGSISEYYAKNYQREKTLSERRMQAITARERGETYEPPVAKGAAEPLNQGKIDALGLDIVPDTDVLRDHDQAERIRLAKQIKHIPYAQRNGQPCPCYLCRQHGEVKNWS